MSSNNSKNFTTRPQIIFDIETDGLNPSVVWCIAAIDVKTGKEYTYGPDRIAEGLSLLAGAGVLIGHNIISFDLPVLRDLHNLRHTERVVDTLILSRLYKATLPAHSLEFWGKYLKHHKVEYEDWSQFSPEMMNRCLEDVRLNLKLFELFQKHSYRIDKNASLLEHYVATHVKQMTEHGFYFDNKLAEDLLIKLRRRKHRLEMKLNDIFCPLPRRGFTYTDDPQEGEKEIKRIADGKISRAILRFTDDPDSVVGPFSRVTWSDVNFNSGQFLIGHLKLLGWEPEEFTEKGNPKLGEEQLERLARSTIPQAALLGAWDVLDRRITQIQSWLDNQGADKRVHCRVRSPGTWTFRMTHSEPNMSAIPSRGKPYAKLCRSMWTVPKGYSLVGCDASGIQLRVLANAMGDPEYINEVVNGDIHTRNQAAAGLDTRDKAKTFIYAFLLGAGDEKLGQISGESPERQRRRGQKLRKNFLTAIPAYAKLLDRLQEQARDKKYIIGLDGRRVYVPDPHYALAGLLQADESIIMKRAYWFWSQQVPAHWDAHLVQWSHDEWQVEVKEEYADDLGKLMVDSFKETQVYYNCSVKLDGEYKVGKTWYETH